MSRGRKRGRIEKAGSRQYSPKAMVVGAHPEEFNLAAAIGTLAHAAEILPRDLLPRGCFRHAEVPRAGDTQAASAIGIHFESMIADCMDALRTLLWAHIGESHRNVAECVKRVSDLVGSGRFAQPGGQWADFDRIVLLGAVKGMKQPLAVPEIHEALARSGVRKSDRWIRRECVTLGVKVRARGVH